MAEPCYQTLPGLSVTGFINRKKETICYLLALVTPPLALALSTPVWTPSAKRRPGGLNGATTDHQAFRYHSVSSL